ncbi:MAG: hypothetical protein WC614_07230 [bacterium]
MNLLLILSFFINTPDSLHRIVGPLGLWGVYDDSVFSAPGVPEKTPFQDAFKFGEYLFLNVPTEGKLPFKDWLNNACEKWNVEKVVAIIRPPYMSGVVNLPLDTHLLTPNWPPGIIQGAARMSRLSKIYGQIYGIDIDDFSDRGGFDTASVQDIRDALKGKYIDSAGVVHHDTPETTPELKFFTVLYPGRFGIASEYVRYVDGFNLWIYNQNAYYEYIDKAIDKYRAKYPGKEITCGIYLINNDYGWQSPQSVRYMYTHLFDRYDDGDINGIILFAGYWIGMPHTPRNRWESNHIIALLDTIYYPYLGEGEGKVYNQSHQPLDSVFISCFSIGRVSKDTLIRSKKRTNSDGAYKLGLWAGNRKTDSTLYYIVARKEGYLPDTVSAWVPRQKISTFPDIILKSK